MDNETDINVVSDSVKNDSETIVIENTTDSTNAEQKKQVTDIMQRLINIVGEENSKKIIEEGLLITTQKDMEQIINNVGENIVNSIGGKDTYQKITEGKVSVVDSDHLKNMTSTIQQTSTILEQSGKTINELQSSLKEQRKMIKRFYQLEAVTLANKQGLESILKCFEINMGWPTIEVYTEHGWVRGSVNYQLHNAIMLAKAAIQSENLVVIEKHLTGLNSVIKQLNQDISDIGKLSKQSYSRCKNCGKIKIAGQVCEHCGTSDVEPDSMSGDDDD